MTWLMSRQIQNTLKTLQHNSHLKLILVRRPHGSVFQVWQRVPPIMELLANHRPCDTLGEFNYPIWPRFNAMMSKLENRHGETTRNRQI